MSVRLGRASSSGRSRVLGLVLQRSEGHLWAVLLGLAIFASCSDEASPRNEAIKGDAGAHNLDAGAGAEPAGGHAGDSESSGGGGASGENQGAEDGGTSHKGESGAGGAADNANEAGSGGEPTGNEGVGRDPFGVRMLYASLPGGREWYANWDDFPRGFEQSDPEDAWFDTNHGDAYFDVRGDGTLKISGSTPRAYVHDPDRVEPWRNVEITVYFRRVADSDVSYAGLAAYARTNHGTTDPEAENPCDTRGLGARMRYDGAADFEKETRHPDAVSASRVALWPDGMPFDTWFGYKYVVYDLPNGAVKMELYLDESDGEAGGTWQLVNEFTDTGDNFGVDGTPCEEGIDPALPLTADSDRPGSESGNPNATIYFRSDDVGTDGLWYKKASVREIRAP